MAERLGNRGFGRGAWLALALSGCVPWSFDPTVDADPTLIFPSHDRVNFVASAAKGEAPVETVTIVSESDFPTTLWNYTAIEGDGVFSVPDDFPTFYELPPHGQLDIPVRFEPRRDGVFEGVLRVMRDRGDPLVVVLQGRGTAPSVDLLPLAVQDTAVGCTSSVGITLVNDGSETLELSMPPQDTGPFHVVGDVPDVVMPGGQATISLAYQPIRTGTSRATLELETNSPDQDPLFVPVQGHAIDGAVVTEHWNYATGNGLAVLVLADLGTNAGWTSRFSNELEPMLEALDAYGIDWRVTSTSTQGICSSFPDGYGVGSEPRYSVLRNLRSTLFNGTNGPFVDHLVELTQRVVGNGFGCFEDFAVAGQPVLVVAADDSDDASAKQYLEALRNSPADVHFATFLPGGACGIQTPQWDVAIAATTGIHADLCANDWADQWDGIARNAAMWEGGPTTFILGNVPRTGTLSVEVDGVVTSNYSYDPYTRMISFRTPLAVGADVEATYLPEDACPE